MIEKDEVLLKTKNEWKHFSKPNCIISAAGIDDVRGSMEEVERLVNANNWYAAGFVSYEAAPAFDNALRVRNSGDFPLVWFGLYSEPLVVEALDLLKDIRNLDTLNWKVTTAQATYNKTIEKIKAYIATGKTYQVNYTMRLNSEFIGEGWDLFLNLIQSQNKYAAFINTGRFEICSASPELFFKLDGDKIYCHPMKGTVKRGRTTLEDQEKADWLYQSQKNRAENVMIVDMVRNDLGRIAEIGSVQVPDLFKIEKYSTLFQMTSMVQAKTQASFADIFSALFPSASITGAPKVSTMNIIAELESTPRRVYTGSIGYLSPGRKAQFNVGIRTVIIDRKDNTAEYGIGGGIVWDSTGSDEYKEAMLKARVLTEKPNEFSLLETLLWTPQDGYFLLEKHFERMEDSARYFDIPFSRTAFYDLLDEQQNKFSSSQRIRILIDRFGNYITESKDLILEPKIFNVKIANNPIDSSNRFYFHKTTYRDIYPSLDGFDDILLYNESGELTEFTIGNLVVEMSGKLVTPPVSCGLLAGTFRAHLLESGNITEQIIRMEELKDCKNIFLVNSLRKWTSVKIK